jgi:hypothetical protein
VIGHVFEIKGDEGGNEGWIAGRCTHDGTVSHAFLMGEDLLILCGQVRKSASSRVRLPSLQVRLHADLHAATAALFGPTWAPARPQSTTSFFCDDAAVDREVPLGMTPTVASKVLRVQSVREALLSDDRDWPQAPLPGLWPNFPQQLSPATSFAPVAVDMGALREALMAAAAADTVDLESVLRGAVAAAAAGSPLQAQHEARVPGTVVAALQQLGAQPKALELLRGDPALVAVAVPPPLHTHTPARGVASALCPWRL